ncbi:MAG: neutral/alkaline non-lysosomal ceramidase N-terminal domain-containing protein [Cyclobacteriaceae bacterium]
MLRKILKWLLYISLALIVLTVLLIAPIAHTPLNEQPFYQAMMKRLDTIKPIRHQGTSKTKVGWSKFNITPSYSMPMAGYTPKDKFETIHDSVYCRVLSIDNGVSLNFIVTIDLMLFPPIIKDKVIEQLKKQGKDYFVYFSATHTHSSLGGWDASLVGRVALGTYQTKWVDQTVNDIFLSFEKARTSSLPSTIAYWETDATEFVENRLDGANGKTDGKLRGLKFIRVDSSKAVMATYSGHATTVGLLNRIISGDYPTALTNHLEKDEFDFGMFLAGMVGSHRLKGFDGDEFERIEATGKTLSEKIIQATNQKLTDSISISSAHISIEFGLSQLRIANNWKVRDWVFSSVIGKLQGELTVLQIGNVLLIGTPCDFSGEIFADENLESFAEKNGKTVIITSFNGNYVGYITADRYYEKGNEEEVMALNWVGPYFGAYYSEMIKKIVLKF